MASQPDFFFMCCKRVKFDVNHLQAVGMKEFLNSFIKQDYIFNVKIEFESGFYLLVFLCVESKTINIVVCETIDECCNFIHEFRKAFHLYNVGYYSKIFFTIHETISEKDLLGFTFISDEQRNMEKRIREIKNARKEDVQEA
jgi:hypothetical protein